MESLQHAGAGCYLLTAFWHKAGPSVSTTWYFSDLSSAFATCSYSILTACAATFILNFEMPKMTHSHYNLWNVKGSGGHMTYVLDKFREFTCASLLHFLISCVM